MDTERRMILRTEAQTARDTLTESERTKWSRRICYRLIDLPIVRDAEVVFVYMHFRSEVQTGEFIDHCLRQGKVVAIPHTLSEEKRLLSVRITDRQLDTEPGYCGIPEPRPGLLRGADFVPEKIDVAIVPGSVFDRAGGRLGYGGGYYDRFLFREARRAFRIGLAYDMQIVDRVPVERHDQLMDLVVTESNIYDCRRNRHAQDGSL